MTSISSVRTTFVSRVLACTLALAFVGAASAQEAPRAVRLETADFHQVAQRTAAEVATAGAAHVLLVLDIDNTLLAMNQDLGSDAWWEWQSELLASQPQSPLLVGQDFESLLRAQSVLFSLSQMHPPEPRLPALVAELQQLNLRTVVLTSRSPDFRDAAERELARNGYDFRRSALRIREPQRGPFAPYDKSRPDLHGLSADELASLPVPRNVSYSSGVLMTAGQHKGVMLRCLLARSKHPTRTIVMADDHLRNTERMHEAFRDSDIKVVTFRYSREDGNVARFRQSDKSHVDRGWRHLQRAIGRSLVR